MTARARTVFLGTGSFAVPIVRALADHQAVELIAVVSAPPRTGSRGRSAAPPVVEWALANDLPLYRPEKLRSAEAVDQLVKLAPDLLVLADYGQIVPASLLQLAPHGALNLHPSLLPRHRGATPIPATILADDAQTGVTLMLMDAGLDRGPIVAQSSRPLDGTETAPELERVLAADSARLLSENLEPWLQGSMSARPQPSVGTSLSRPLRRADGRLDPFQPVSRLERQVRAYQPWPGAYVETSAGRLAVWRAHVASRAHGASEPAPLMTVGTLGRTAGNGLALVVGDGCLELDEVQPSGGRRMDAADLLRGRPMFDGARVLESADGGT